MDAELLSGRGPLALTPVQTDAKVSWTSPGEWRMLDPGLSRKTAVENELSLVDALPDWSNGNLTRRRWRL
jgi:hypothetical protein